MKNYSAYRTLKRFSRGSRALFAAAVVSAAVSILFNFLLPRVVGYTVDAVLGTESYVLPSFLQKLVDSLGGRNGLRESFIFCTAGVLLCAAVSALFNYISRITIAKGAEGFTQRMRDTLFAHVQKLPFSWHTANQTGDIIQRCTSDVDTAKRFVSQQLIDVVRTVILLLLAFFMMFSLNTVMAIVCGVFVPIIFLYTSLFYTRISSKFRECDEAEGELMVKVQENLTGVRVVRAFGRERYELDTFDEKNDYYTNKWKNLGYTLSAFWGIGDVVSAFQLLAVVSVGAYLAAVGKISLGTMLVFISYTQTMGGPVRQLGRVLSEMSKTGVALSRIEDILSAEPEKEPENPLTPPLDRDISVKNVTFGYGDRVILEDVSFDIPAGTTFGILGETGSGKSTITYLLNRLYDIDDGCGEITVGGVDIRKISLPYLRRNVGLVLQEPFLFSKTIFENIDIASHTNDIAKVRAAAKTAAVDKDISEFVSGYDTIVGERGVTLSGGQKQRIAMARTLMLHSPIMIFDDSMSNLDMETDAQIRDALKSETGNATVILVSHRISTLMTADKILVLENGRVAQLGTHEELLAKEGIYRRVYDIQAGYSKEAI